MAAPLCRDFLNQKLNLNKPPSLAIVVSPVTALIQDQIRHLSGVGITALHGVKDSPNWESSTKDIKAGKFSLVFPSPEILGSQHGKDLLVSSEVQENIRGIVYLWTKANALQIGMYNF